MANKFYETKEFKKLNEEWAKKLEDSEFVDIEKNTTEYEYLPVAFDARKTMYKTLETTKEYFSQADDFLQNGKFNSTKEREIWEHHCNGDSIREIAAKMKLTSSPVAYHIWNVQKRTNLKKKK